MSLVFYAAHLYFLSAVASALFLVVQVFRNFFFAHPFSEKVHKYGLFFLLSLFLLVYILKGGEDSYSYLSLMGSSIGTVALSLKNTRNIRLLFFFSTIPWIIYMVYLESIFGIIMQLAYFSSVAINIIRFDILRKK